MGVAELQLDLDVFSGPFDLLTTLVLREEVDLMEVELVEVVLAYIEHLEQAGELDLEAATEFLVLIAALLELKSRLLLPRDEEEDLDLAPEEAADELLARMLEHRRYARAAVALRERYEVARRYHYRSAPLPPELRRVSLDVATAAYDPTVLAEALGGLLRVPPLPDTGHIRVTVSLDRRLRVLRELLARGSFDFDRAVEGEDRLTQAVTVFALLELYRRGEATWDQPEHFGPIKVTAT